MTNTHDKLKFNILVVGLARNCEKHIAEAVSKISDSLSEFQSVSWLVVESDSNDNTEQKLKEIGKSSPNFRHLSLGTLRDKLPLRTARIAHCRNKYLDEINSNPIYQAIHYIIVADLDGANSLISKNAVMSCFTQSNWDVCTANQRGPYYDIWALRHRHWSPNDCWEYYHFLLKIGIPEEKALCNAILSRMISVPPKQEWVEVDSAFGGFAIYRRSAIGEARYFGLTENQTEICEHVTFHQQLRSQGRKIYINPQLINCGWNEHSSQIRLWNRSLKRGKRLLKHFLFKFTTKERLIRIKSKIIQTE